LNLEKIMFSDVTPGLKYMRGDKNCGVASACGVSESVLAKQYETRSRESVLALAGRRRNDVARFWPDFEALSVADGGGEDS
jgi:hypothetical protein